MELNDLVVTTPPIPAATVILLRDAPGGFELFMVQRHNASSSFGGAHVFPGGKLDPADREAPVLARVRALPAHLHEALADPGLDEVTAAALYVAACRETFEECGVLLAHGADAGLQGRAVTAHRKEGASFVDVLERFDLQVDVGGMSAWSRWITPVIPSMTTKRFDTRFFVVALPAGQHAEHDNHEASDSLWITPLQGLERYWARQLELAPPQIMTLAHLARFGSVAQVLAEAGRRPPPVIQPEPMKVDGARVVAYPGDPSHPLRERAMPGPSRLMVRDGRFEPVDGSFSAFLA